MEPEVTTSIAWRTNSGPAEKPQIGPGAGNDRLEHQLIVAFRPDDDQADIRPRTGARTPEFQDCPRWNADRRRRIRCPTRRSALQAADYRDELCVARLRGLIEDTSQAGNANGLNGKNANANGTRIRRSGFHGPPFGVAKGLPWDRHARIPENLWLLECLPSIEHLRTGSKAAHL